MKSAHGVGFGWSSGVRRRSTGCSAAREASAAPIGSIGSGTAFHSSGPASPVVAKRSSRSKKCTQPSAWLAACSAFRPSCTRVTREPVPIGSIVTVTVEASGGRSSAALPAPAEHDAAAGLDLAVGAGGDVPGDHGEPVGPAGPEVDRRAHGLPAPQPLRLGDQREGLVGRDGQVAGDRVGPRGSVRGGAGHRGSSSPWWVRLAATRWASAANRSSSAVQNDSISRWRRRTPSCSTR